MLPLGSVQRPIIVKVKSSEKAEKVAKICEQYDWKYIIGLEATEDLTDLKRAMKERMKTASPYDPCPCHSGKKYRFCCAKKSIELDI
ncbi:SEC-C domain-containing protein [Bacillus sp. BRMEA1]|uniref:SEC-C metal-binding domain-containing protein n=1 Tax=Neobacillus endophyticus TaxID=2738405 RepID=UPI0015670664|nr:SEC-C metal-binding domain-containing protein [Neobacillus endophyticus]NRD80962.1 SEC-C domain-containing protein [Neobacillus endophyticus]